MGSKVLRKLGSGMSPYQLECAKWRGHTKHEVWDIYDSPGFLCVFICKKPGVDQFPTKQIGDDDDDAWFAFARGRGFSDISWQIGDGAFCALGSAIVDEASYATGAYASFSHDAMVETSRWNELIVV